MPGTVVKKKNTATEVQSSFLVNSLWNVVSQDHFPFFAPKSTFMGSDTTPWKQKRAQPTAADMQVLPRYPLFIAMNI